MNVERVRIDTDSMQANLRFFHAEIWPGLTENGIWYRIATKSLKA
jgi:hypothetical protein